MTDSTSLLKLVAMGAARPTKTEHRLDFNALAIAAQTTEAWHLYIAFACDTAKEGGLPGICSIVLPEAEEQDVLRILKSGIELGGYHLQQQLGLTDLTDLLGAGVSQLLARPSTRDDPLCLARIIVPDGSYDLKIKGNLIELREKP